MPKILFLQNCQGAQYPNFLRAGSDTFTRDWETLKTIQAQSIKASDGPWLKSQMEAADVIVAQPLYSMPVEGIRTAALRTWADSARKPLIMMPALQYDVIFPSTIPSQWANVPGYPFAATEDVMIAAGFACGLSVEATATFFHDVPLLEAGKLREQIDASIAAYENREAESGCAILGSTYYAQNWQNGRLHFTKGHPFPDVTRHFVAALAQELGINDFDASRTAGLLGPYHFRMPLQRWVKAQLSLLFHDPDDLVCCDGTEMTLQDMIRRMFDWYGTQGTTEVNHRLGKFGLFNHAKTLAARV